MHGMEWALGEGGGGMTEMLSGVCCRTRCMRCQRMTSMGPTTRLQWTWASKVLLHAYVSNTRMLNAH